MRPDLVVVPAPRFDADLRVQAIAKPLQRQVLVAELPVERFVGAVLPGLPGSMNAVSICAVCSQRRMARATNSGPLSDRTYRGAPWTLTSCVSTSMTRPERIPPATSIAMHSRVNSSMTVRHFNVRPSAHVSNTKSGTPHVIDRRRRQRPRLPQWREGAIVSSFGWSEHRQAGQPELVEGRERPSRGLGRSPIQFTTPAACPSVAASGRGPCARCRGAARRSRSCRAPVRAPVSPSPARSSSTASLSGWSIRIRISGSSPGARRIVRRDAWISGESSAGTSVPSTSASATSRRISFTSWRTLPGHAYSSRYSSVSSSSARRPFFELLGELPEVVVDQRRNLLAPLAQRRQLQPDDVEAVEEVLAEAAFATSASRGRRWWRR